MLNLLRSGLIVVVATVAALASFGTQAFAVGPQRQCQWAIDGEIAYVQGEGSYECKCTISQGCYWYFLGPDPVVTVDGREIHMTAGVPADLRDATRQVRYDVFVPQGADASVIRQPATQSEVVTIHRTAAATGVTVVVKVLSRDRFPTLIVITDGNNTITRAGETNSPTTIELN